MAYDPEIDELERWFTPRRFRIAWTLARVGRSSWVLVSDLGYSSREIYRWKNGEAIPNRRALVSINRLFSRLLGENWKERVDSFTVWR